MRFLVTGGSGFIGSALVDVLLGKGHEVVDYSSRTYAFNDHLPFAGSDRYRLEQGDITDGIHMMHLLSSDNFDGIFHLAAETHVDRSFVYPDRFLHTNVMGAFTLMDCVRHMERKPKVIAVSTDEVFGSISHLAKEDDHLLPENPYSASKASAEMYYHAYHRSYGIPVTIARSMNNFGPRQHPEKLIAKIITSIIQHRPYSLYEGNSRRGWIYSYDTADALYCLFEKGLEGKIYHIPPAAYRTVEEVNNTIMGLLGKDLFEGYRGRRLKDDESYALDGSLMADTLVWKPSTSFEEGIRKTIQWYKG
jgi:dTDP-glucose 4,6-dehydratase